MRGIEGTDTILKIEINTKINITKVKIIDMNINIEIIN